MYMVVVERSFVLKRYLRKNIFELVGENTCKKREESLDARSMLSCAGSRNGQQSGWH
jgi:hypothetical protein